MPIGGSNCFNPPENDSILIPPTPCLAPSRRQNEKHDRFKDFTDFQVFFTRLHRSAEEHSTLFGAIATHPMRQGSASANFGPSHFVRIVEAERSRGHLHHAYP